MLALLGHRLGLYEAMAGCGAVEVARAQDFGGAGYDLVCTCDCLHDMGDPVGAAAGSRAFAARRRRR